jgi:hypothetical protein
MSDLVRCNPKDPRVRREKADVDLHHVSECWVASLLKTQMPLLVFSYINAQLANHDVELSLTATQYSEIFLSSQKARPKVGFSKGLLPRLKVGNR